jgi:hypothetical protein
VDIGYAIDNEPVTQCHASRCEAQKSDLRGQIRANEKAWEKAEKALASRMATECPDTGWDKAGFDECQLTVRAGSAEEMAGFPLKDQELRDQMAAVDPENCQVYSGELVTK